MFLNTVLKSFDRKGHGWLSIANLPWNNFRRILGWSASAIKKLKKVILGENIGKVVDFFCDASHVDPQHSEKLFKLIDLGFLLIFHMKWHLQKRNWLGPKTSVCFMIILTHQPNIGPKWLQGKFTMLIHLCNFCRYRFCMRTNICVDMSQKHLFDSSSSRISLKSHLIGNLILSTFHKSHFCTATNI